GTPLPHRVPPDRAPNDQGDERDRHLPDDEATTQGSWPSGAVLAAFIPCCHGHRPSRAGRGVGGCPAPCRARRPENYASLRSAKEEGHAEHRGADFCLNAERDWLLLAFREKPLCNVATHRRQTLEHDAAISFERIRETLQVGGVGRNDAAAPVLAPIV